MTRKQAIEHILNLLCDNQEPSAHLYSVLDADTVTALLMATVVLDK